MTPERKVVAAHLKIVGQPEPPETEYQRFEVWWEKYAQTLNSRATLTWIELAWSGWFARSEIADGNEPTVWKRKGPDE